MKLLLVGDDFDLSSALSRGLEASGFDVLRCEEGDEAMLAAREKPFDVIVLDLTLPGLEGLEPLAHLRDGGLAKPFDLDALTARLQALSRQMGRDGELRCGLLHHDTTSGAFYRDGRPLDLSPREGQMLRTLMSHVGRVVSKDTLRSAVFGDDDVIQPDAVEVIVHRLRKRIVDSSTEILTLRGVGYLLCDAAEAAARRGTR